MKSTTLVAAVALVLGLLLAGGGSVVLAHARAAVRSTRPWHATITQYPAALSALLGFLLTSVAGGVLCWQLAPLHGAGAVLAAVASGVILFAVVGAGFARVADRVEAGRLRQVPDEVHRPISPVAALPAGTASAAAVAQAPRAPLAIQAPPVPAQRASEDPATAWADQRARPGGNAYGDALSTPLVEVRRPARAALPPAPIQDTPPASASAWDVPDADLQAGWMYYDDADGWFLAIGTPGGALLLLGLPSFALVDPNGPAAPVGVLRRAGAAELTVLPDATEPPATPDADPPPSDPAPSDPDAGPVPSDLDSRGASPHPADTAQPEVVTTTASKRETETAVNKADTAHKTPVPPSNAAPPPNEAEEG